MSQENSYMIIRQLFHCAFFFFYAVTFIKHWRYPKKTTYAAINLYTAVVFLVSQVLFFYGVLPSYYNAAFFVIYLFGTTVLIFSLAEFRNGQLLFSYLSIYVFLFMSSSVSHFLIPNLPSLFYVLAKQGVTAALSVILYVYFRPIFFQAMDRLNKGWFELSMIPLGILPIYCILVFSEEETVLYLAFSVSVGLIYFALYWGLKAIQEQYRSENESLVLNSQIEEMKIYAELIQKDYEQMRIFRHDLRHYGVILENDLMQGDASQALASFHEFLDKYVQDASLYPSDSAHGLTSYTGDFFMDTLLSLYQRQAREASIQFQVAIRIPKPFPADTMEFCVLLSNSLQNAIQACEAMPPGQSRVVRVTAFSRQQQFFYEVQNTYSGQVVFDKDHIPVSPTSGHGYGCQSMKAFAQKFHAILEFQAQDGWFRLRLLL